MKPTRGGRLRLHRRSVRIPTANDLVFIKESPDYCHHNSTIGSLGQSSHTFLHVDDVESEIVLINVLNISTIVLHNEVKTQSYFYPQIWSFISWLIIRGQN